MARRDNKNELDLFDVISRVKKDEGGSIWQGQKGLYIIRHIEGNPSGRRKVPLAKVILNHQFLTGLFASKRSEVFTGDMKDGARRRFMVFKVLDAARMEVHIQK